MFKLYSFIEGLMRVALSWLGPGLKSTRNPNICPLYISR